MPAEPDPAAFPAGSGPAARPTVAGPVAGSAEPATAAIPASGSATAAGRDTGSATPALPPVVATGPRPAAGPASETAGSKPTGPAADVEEPLVGAEVEDAPGIPLREIGREFWPDTQGYRRRMLIGLLLIPVPPLLAAAGIWLFKVLVDDVLTPRNYALFPWVAAGFVAVTLAEGLFSFIDHYLAAWVAERFVLTLRTRVFAHLHTLSVSFFDRHQLGDLLSRITGDVGAIESLLLSGVNQALTYSFQIVFFTGALFVLDWRLALAALLATPFFLLLARSFARRIQSASREQRRSAGMITAVAEESLHNVSLVQAYGRQDHEAGRFHREGLRSFTAKMVAAKLEALFTPFTDILEVIGVLAVVGFGIHELSQDRITLGGLIVFIGYLTQLYGPITGFGDLTNEVFAATAGAERVIELLRTEPGVRPSVDPLSIGRARGALRADEVTFRYPGHERPALRGVSLSAEPGQTVAIVGASGAGKSTLARVLLRLHDPDSGSVFLDEVDLRRLPIKELRDNIAVVLQETLVFDGTVEENIRWGKPDATVGEVERAAAAADAHGFISALPAGYQTRIGQRGMMLSGGQRQRIALARAMIRDAPVLLLDEPTTGLDALSTQRVLEPLRRAMTGRTTVVISHNLLTVTDADRIVYLERGRVVGTGTHDELMISTPGYAQLYRLHHPAPRSRPGTARPVTTPGIRPGAPARFAARPSPARRVAHPDAAPVERTMPIERPAPVGRPAGRPVAPPDRPVAPPDRPVAPAKRPVAPPDRPVAPAKRPVAPVDRTEPIPRVAPASRPAPAPRPGPSPARRHSQPRPAQSATPRPAQSATPRSGQSAAPRPGLSPAAPQPTPLPRVTTPSPTPLPRRTLPPVPLPRAAVTPPSPIPVPADGADTPAMVSMQEAVPTLSRPALRAVPRPRPRNRPVPRPSRAEGPDEQPTPQPMALPADLQLDRTTPSRRRCGEPLVPPTWRPTPEERRPGRHALG
jgi:ABC-type multidrug transport system fused ATPase/permease subunit